MKACIGLLLSAGFLLLLSSIAEAATCSSQSLTLQTVSGNVTVCMGGGASGPYWSQQELVDSNNVALDSAAGTTNPGARAIAVQGISSGVALPVSATALPLPSNAVQETGGNVASINTEIGALGSSAASADTGSFNLNAMIQRLNQHLTTINSTLGTPLQAGGSIIGTVNGGGTAGSANAGVMSVQGVASMTPLLTNPGTAANWGVQTQGSTTSGQSGTLIQGAVTTSAPSYTTAQTSPISLDTSGNLRVTLSSGNISSNITQINSNTISTAATGTQLVGIEGHAGASLDVTIGGAAAPTNALVSGLEYLSVLPTLTTGQAAGLQGDSSARLIISPTNLSIAQGSTTSGQTGDLIMGAVTTGAPSYTTAQSSPISLDTAGNLRTNCVVGCSSNSFLDEGAFTQGTTAVQPIAGIYSTSITNLSSGQAGAVQLTNDRMMYTNLGKIGGSTYALGQAAMASSAPVVIASNQTNLPANTVQVGGSTITVNAGAVGAGSQRIAVGQDTTTIAGSAPGTAGTASANVLSVQGIASMTPVLANPGTAANWGVGATGSAVPANAQYTGAVSAGNLTGLIQADSSAAINVSTATTTQLVALTSGQKIYVTSLNVISAGTGNITFEYGTGASCGTGTTVLTGAYNLTAQTGLSLGSGLGPVLVVPASNALCVLTSQAVQMSGSVSYTKF